MTHFTLRVARSAPAAGPRRLSCRCTHIADVAHIAVQTNRRTDEKPRRTDVGPTDSIRRRTWVVYIVLSRNETVPSFVRSFGRRREARNSPMPAKTLDRSRTRFVCLRTSNPSTGRPEAACHLDVRACVPFHSFAARSPNDDIHIYHIYVYIYIHIHSMDVSRLSTLSCRNTLSSTPRKSAVQTHNCLYNARIMGVPVPRDLYRTPSLVILWGLSNAGLNWGSKGPGFLYHETLMVS
jgi:hypothetical protein